MTDWLVDQIWPEFHFTTSRSAPTQPLIQCVYLFIYFFMVNLMMLSVAQTLRNSMVEWLMYWKGCGTKQSWPIWKHYPGTHLQALGKIMKNVKTISVPAQIWTSHPQIWVECIIAYANLVGDPACIKEFLWSQVTWDVKLTTHSHLMLRSSLSPHHSALYVDNGQHYLHDTNIQYKIMYKLIKIFQIKDQVTLHVYDKKGSNNMLARHTYPKWQIRSKHGRMIITRGKLKCWHHCNHNSTLTAALELILDPLQWETDHLLPL
jgi:hypothetical protein